MTKRSISSPEKMGLRETRVRVTLYISKESHDFFKALGAKIDVPYQRTIRRVLDEYTQLHNRDKSHD